MSTPILSRRIFCGAAFALIGTAGLAAEPPRDVRFAQDFDELWTTLAERYAYFDQKRTDWACVRSRYRPQAIAAENYEGFQDVLGEVLNELYDRHTFVRGQRPDSPRGPFFDMLAERDGQSARVLDILDGSAADAAGMTIGDRIVAVDGRPISTLVSELMPKCLSGFDPAAEAYAINSAVSGRQGQPRRLTVRSGEDPPRRLDVPLRSMEPKPEFESSTLEGGIGYIAIRSFADEKIASDFDSALARFSAAPGIIIDVRNNGGGDTAVARPIMGRFIRERAPYALMKRREGAGLSEPWTEYVEPRGPFTYDKPVVVLTNHWSASMAEGFPMGMRGLGRAIIVGTPMMRLGAAVFDLRLDRTGTNAQYSGEPVYDTGGAPRDDLQPDVRVGYGSDILKAGVAELQNAIAKGDR